MKNNYFVSIIVPAYNVENYISRCVVSLLEQTYSFLEIIVVDDGSTDGTLGILESFEDERLQVISQKNNGLSAARNKGIDVAKGDYILFVDGDDFLLTDSIQCLMHEVTKKPELEIVLFSHMAVKENVRKKVYLSENTGGIDARKVWEYLIGPSNKQLKDPSVICRFNTAWGKMYRRDAIGTIRFEDTSMIGVEDGWFNIQVFHRVKCISYLQEVFYCYEKGNSLSITHNYDECFWDKRKNAFKLINQYIEQYGENNLQSRLDNRISLEIIGYVEKIICSNLSPKEKKLSLDGILQDEMYKNAIQELDFAGLSNLWKVFFFLCKRKKSVEILFLSTIFLKWKRYVIQW